MAELAPGITGVATTARDNAFLVEGTDGLTLVDVGWASAPAVIESALAGLGRTLRDIRRIVLTHAHPDHVRGAAELKARTGAALLIHTLDAGWLRAGRVPPAGRSGCLGRLLDRAPLLHWHPVAPDGLLTDGQYVDGAGGLRVIHTPGHTPGHIVLHHEPSNTVLLGDAVFHRGGKLSVGPAALAAEPRRRPASLGRLPTRVDAVGFAHGDPLRGHGVDRYAALLTRLTVR